MKVTKYFLFFFVIAFAFVVRAQGVADPATITVFQTTDPIVVDGNLNEPVWSIPFPHLMFKQDGVPMGWENTPTAGLVIKPVYTDVTTTHVMMVRSGMDLYIALESDDQQVCRFGDNWEGDGMFMKISSNGGANTYEFKLYYNRAGIDQPINFETNAPAGSGEGAGVEGSNTIVNDSSNVDNGYTAEMVIHLDQLGYDAGSTNVPININIFDPDNYTDGVGAWGVNGNFYKQWWGSEWGTDRAIVLSYNNVPVELTSFTATAVNNDVELHWTTASELNNHGFQLERSTDGINFVVRSFIPGAGTTTEEKTYTFIDNDLGVGKYFYRLRQLDFEGSFAIGEAVEVNVLAAGSYALDQNFPNPFNPTTTIRFSLPEASNVKLRVFNVLGTEVASLIDGMTEAGVYEIPFDAVNLASGTYFYRLEANGFVQTNSMMLIK